MTGYAEQRERAHGLDAIIHDVIAKPFSVASLRQTVNEVLTVKASWTRRQFSPRPIRHRDAAAALSVAQIPDAGNPASGCPD